VVFDLDRQRPAASAAVRASLAAELGRAGVPRPLPAALLDVVVERVPLPPGSAALVLRPRDWRVLREVTAEAGRPTPYWAIPWPSGIALARAAARAALAGARVLELGCGLGLPSLAAARAGARVLATDGTAEAAVFAAHTLAVNAVEGETAQASWEDAGALAERGPWDRVLAADVLYLRTNVRLLLDLLPRVLAPGGEAWIADPGRSGAREFLAAARHRFRLSSRRDPERPDVAVHTLSA
jgi:predicted nicotinamide N-methyase